MSEKNKLEYQEFIESCKRSGKNYKIVSTVFIFLGLGIVFSPFWLKSSESKMINILILYLILSGIFIIIGITDYPISSNYKYRVKVTSYVNDELKIMLKSYKGITFNPFIVTCFVGFFLLSLFAPNEYVISKKIFNIIPLIGRFDGLFSFPFLVFQAILLEYINTKKTNKIVVVVLNIIILPILLIALSSGLMAYAQFFIEILKNSIYNSNFIYIAKDWLKQSSNSSIIIISYSIIVLSWKLSNVRKFNDRIYVMEKLISDQEFLNMLDEAEENEQLFCSKCGKTISNESNYCPNCGKKRSYYNERE